MKNCKVTVLGRDISEIASGETIRIKLSTGAIISIEAFERRQGTVVIESKATMSSLAVYPRAGNSIHVG